MRRAARRANLLEHMVELDGTPESTPRDGRVRALLTAIAAAAVVTLVVFAGGVKTRDTSGAPPPSASARPSATPVRTPTVDLVTSVALVAADLRFVPLLPAPAPPGASAHQAGCGIATSPCLWIAWAPATPASPPASILEGPAGCCLDGVRGDARRSDDSELRPGLWGHWEDVDGRFGGPSLWWVDASSDEPVYVAVSVPHADRDTLVRVARSLVPLRPSP